MKTDLHDGTLIEERDFNWIYRTENTLALTRHHEIQEAI